MWDLLVLWLCGRADAPAVCQPWHKAVAHGQKHQAWGRALYSHVGRCVAGTMPWSVQNGLETFILEHSSGATAEVYRSVLASGALAMPSLCKTQRCPRSVCSRLNAPTACNTASLAVLVYLPPSVQPMHWPGTHAQHPPPHTHTPTHPHIHNRTTTRGVVVPTQPWRNRHISEDGRRPGAPFPLRERGL